MILCKICGVSVGNRIGFVNHATDLHAWTISQAESEYQVLERSLRGLKLGEHEIRFCQACRKWWEHNIAGRAYACARCGTHHSMQ